MKKNLEYLWLWFLYTALLCPAQQFLVLLENCRVQVICFWFSNSLFWCIELKEKNCCLQLKNSCIIKGLIYCPFTDSGFMNYHFLYSSGQVDIRSCFYKVMYKLCHSCIMWWYLSICLFICGFKSERDSIYICVRYLKWILRKEILTCS
jgi:hypothetical protein